MTTEKAIEFGKIFLKTIENEKGSATYEFVETAVKALEEEPYEKFENAKDHIYKLASDYKCWDNRITDDEAIELCHILEQEPILDKIRAEINELPSYAAKFNGGDFTIHIDKEKVFEIIDKYKAESEDNE